MPIIERGEKWIRRFLMPAILSVFLIVLGASWQRAVIACALLSAATTLPYGDGLANKISVKYNRVARIFLYAISGLAMGFPALIVSYPRFNWLVLLPSIYHTVYGAISLYYNRFSWAFVATLMGMGIGIAYVTSVRLP